MSRRNTSLECGALLIPITAVWGVVPGLTPVATMGAIAVSMFYLIKAHVFWWHWSKADNENRPHAAASFGWFFLWPGLNARHFFEVKSPSRIEWRRVAIAVCEIVGGMILLLILAPGLRESHPVLAGWCGLTGIALILHFGFFNLLSSYWNARGRHVKPIMNAPLVSTSVGEFWGRRWNLAFRDYAHKSIFAPLARRFGGTVGAFSGFLYSGLIHEVAISVPANGGYGLPMVYFGLQGFAVLVEKRIEAAGFQIRDTSWGWAWSIVWVLVPAPFLLFHLPFIRRVVLPIVDGVNFVAGS